ncbi:hypothetical protein [Pedobacter sp. JCM 36344]|uniref:hypothetical protein n=1 Tax=Pedobacter sp. JCM 36344 TaxID=3374280 RepID=UPI00397BEA57
MKRTILALALFATTFGAFAQTPATKTKPVMKKEKSHKKGSTITPKAVEKKKAIK